MYSYFNDRLLAQLQGKLVVSKLVFRFVGPC